MKIDWMKELNITRPNRQKFVEQELRKTLAGLVAGEYSSTTEICQTMWPVLDGAPRTKERSYMIGQVVKLGKALGLNSRAAAEPRTYMGRTVYPREWTYLPLGASPTEQAAPPPDWRTEIERRVAALEAKLSISVSDLI